MSCRIQFMEGAYSGSKGFIRPLLTHAILMNSQTKSCVRNWNNNLLQNGACAILLSCIIFSFCGDTIAEQVSIPFEDMNDIRYIDVNNSSMSFVSPSGILELDTQQNHWALKYQPGKNNRQQGTGNLPPRAAHEERVDVKTFPDWVPADFRGIKQQLNINGNVFWLVTVTSEDSRSVTDSVIDLNNRVIYSIPFQQSQSLAVVGDNIWLGHPRGITRINRISRQRIDYQLFPIFAKITGWVKYKEKYYISTSDGHLYGYDPQTRQASRLSYSPDTFDKLYPTLAEKQLANTSQYYFTNPVLQGSLLHVGVLPLNIHGKAGNGNSGVLTFDLGNPHNAGNIQSLGLESDGSIKQSSGKFGIKKLVMVGNDVFMLGNSVDVYEGGEYVQMGGISILTSYGRRFDVPECGNLPVVAIKASDKHHVAILSKQMSEDERNSIYFECNLLLNEPNPNISVSDKLANSIYSVRVVEKNKLQAGDKRVKQYDMLTFELSPQQTRELIKDWQVKYELNIDFNRPLTVEDYHSPVYQDIDGKMHPERSEQTLQLN